MSSGSHGSYYSSAICNAEVVCNLVRVANTKDADLPKEKTQSRDFGGTKSLAAVYQNNTALAFVDVFLYDSSIVWPICEGSIY